MDYKYLLCREVAKAGEVGVLQAAVAGLVGGVRSNAVKMMLFLDFLVNSALKQSKPQARNTQFGAVFDPKRGDRHKRSAGDFLRPPAFFSPNLIQNKLSHSP